MNVEGDEETCDGCLAEQEDSNELRKEGVIGEMVNDCY
jgi:hypothetical protein